MKSATSSQADDDVEIEFGNLVIDIFKRRIRLHELRTGYEHVERPFLCATKYMLDKDSLIYLYVSNK